MNHARETIDNHRYKLSDSGARAAIHNGIDGLDVEIAIGSDALEGMIAEGDPSPCAQDRELSAPYRIGYTGGTTGRPKGVTLTTQGELAELSAFLMDLVPEMRAGDTFLHAAPIAHASGAFFLPALARGVNVWRGDIVCEGVAESLGIPYADLAAKL